MSEYKPVDPQTRIDVVEVLPAYDPSQITAYLTANIAFEYISLIALRKKRAVES